MISIHALVKRATKQYNVSMSDLAISIHALVKRATSCENCNGRTDKHFNPRPREEGDLFTDSQVNVPRDFNPRPREEGDQIR